jgi:hypothetical protein
MFSMCLQQGHTPCAVILTAKGFAPSMQARFVTHVLSEFATSLQLSGTAMQTGKKGALTLSRGAAREKLTSKQQHRSR